MEKGKNLEVVPAIERALNIFGYLGNQNKPMTLKEIAGDLDIPSVSTFRIVKYLCSRGYLIEALDAMKIAAEQGKESTRELVAKVGRASHLGERSRGVLDAGATSCYLLLASMSGSIKNFIEAG